MQLYVYSRLALQAARPHEVPHAIISITSAVDDVARFPVPGTCRGVLRVAFPDAETASETFAESVLFSDEHARRIWDFVLLHRADVERIVVHCDAGMSRSPAVAAAIAEKLGLDGSEFLGGRYRPNARVLRALREHAAAAP